MMKRYLMLPLGYLAFAWQATLRPELAWQGYAPNFLALTLILALWMLKDVEAVCVAALLGLLADALAPQDLGCEMLCYLGTAVLTQLMFPPKLLRHPALLVGLVVLATFVITFSSAAVQVWARGTIAEIDLAAAVSEWLIVSLGDGCYTGIIAIIPLCCAAMWQSRLRHQDQPAVVNRWRRLTS